MPATTAATSIGFALVAAVLISGPSAGGAINPVRALGPMLVTWEPDVVLGYLLAPTLGGRAAALLLDRVALRPMRR